MKNKKEKETEELKKSNSVMKGLLICLVVAILVGCSFGIGLFLEKELINKEELQIKELTVNSEVVIDLFEIFKEVDNNGLYDIHENHDFNNDDVKKSLIVSVLETEKKTLDKTCGTLDTLYTNDGYFCDVDSLVRDDNGNINYEKYTEVAKDSNTMTFTTENLTENYLKIFGQNAEYKDESFILTTYPGGYAYYDKTNNIYARFSKGGGSEKVVATQILDSIEQSGTTLKLFTTLTLEEISESNITYTFKFEESTGNYIFVSREVKKVNDIGHDNALPLDVEKVNSVLSSTFRGALNYYGFSANKNSTSIDLYNNRLIRLYVVASNFDTETNYGDGEAYYVTYDVFKKKYIEFYGSADNLDSDFTGVDDSNSYVYKYNDNVLYLGVYQDVYGYSKFNLKKFDFDEETMIYTMTGTYIEYQNSEYGDGSSVNGTFELKYKMFNDKEYLVGFTITRK